MGYNTNVKGILGIVLRYILIIASLFSLPLFYVIFKPITLYLTYFLLKLFFSVQLTGNMLIFANTNVEIIDACVAVSAYFLFLALNLATREIKFGKRVLLFFFTSFVFLVINVIRIFLLTIMLINKSAFFDLTHKVFWYVLSIVFVFLIWILGTKLMKIKQVPVYSDVKWILEKIRIK
jgi:exosortase/archaeosortase family protein